MLDKNLVFLEGIIEGFKYDKAEGGREYATFSLSINAVFREMADDFERTKSQQWIRIFCYNKKIIEHLKRINAHNGQRASVFGRLSSFKNEYKGITFMTNCVMCRDIDIITTRPVNKFGIEIDDEQEQQNDK